MQAIAYKLIMVLIQYLTSKEFIAIIEQKVAQWLHQGERNPDAIVDLVKNDSEIQQEKPGGLKDMIFDMAINAITHEEMTKRHVRVAPEPTSTAGKALAKQKVSAAK